LNLPQPALSAVATRETEHDRFFDALGVAAPLGRDKRQVAANLFAGYGCADIRHSKVALVPNGRIASGASCMATLGPSPHKLAERAAAIIIAAGQSCMWADPATTSNKRQTYGRERIGVCLRHQPSGIDEAHVRSGAVTLTISNYRLSTLTEQELGRPRQLLADWRALSVPAYIDLHACTSSARGVDTDAHACSILGCATRLSVRWRR